MATPAARTETETSWGVALTILMGALVVLLGLGVWGAAVVVRARPAPFAGPAADPPRHYVRVPTLSIVLGRRSVDVQALLETDQPVEARLSPVALVRIQDRMARKLEGVDEGELQGAPGALMVKRLLHEASAPEVASARIRDVMLQGFIVY